MPDPFLPEEDEILKEYFGKIRYKDLMKKVWGRSVNQIKKRADELGLVNTFKYYLPSKYSKEEEEYLIQNYETASWAEILVNLPNRKKSNIAIKANRMGLRKVRKTTWTASEERYLIEMYAFGESIDKIAKELEKSTSSIYHKAKRMGLRR